jgi:hypothetical protein
MYNVCTCIHHMNVYMQGMCVHLTGEKAKWNFEKAHSILHKVSKIVLWGNSNNTSCQAPEVSTNVYVHVSTMYIHICIQFIHVHTMYIHFCTVYIICSTDLQPLFVFSIMPISKRSKLWPMFQIIRMLLCTPALPSSCWLPAAL